MTQQNVGNTCISDLRHQVDHALHDFFEKKRNTLQQQSSDSPLLVDAIADLSLRGGKRFRPLLLMASARAVKPDIQSARLLQSGVALELMQSYFLIHDDWMDQDEQRRGGLSVHCVFEKHGFNKHEAASLAVLAGDLCAAFAWECMAQAAQTHPNHHALMEEFACIEQKVILGQALDVSKQGTPHRVYELKTGSYTTEGPVKLGALIAEASAPQLQCLEAFAKPFGIAFQLRDDLLGCFGKSIDGKTQGEDLRLGKRTVLLELALQSDNPQLQEALKQLQSAERAEEQHVQRLLGLLRAEGIEAQVQTQVCDLQKQSLSFLEHSDLCTEGKVLLHDLCCGALAPY